MKKLNINIRSFSTLQSVAMRIFFALLILLLPSTGSAISLKDQKKIRLTIYYKEAKPTDTLQLNITHRYFLSAEQKTYYKDMDKNGAYIFEIPVKYENGYWELRKLFYKMGSRNIPNLTKAFWWEAGDEIILYLSNKPSGAGVYSICKFEGNGAAKYNTRYRADSLRSNSIAFVKANFDKDGELSPVSNKNLIKLIIKSVEEDKARMSEVANYLTKADVLMTQGKAIFLRIQLYVKENGILIGTQKRKDLLERVKAIYLVKGQFAIDTSKIYLSGNAISFLWYGLKSESFLLFGNSNSRWIFDQIYSRYDYKLRDQILAYWFQYQRIDGNDAELLYKEALMIVKSVDALNQLKSVEHFYLKKQLKNYSLPNPKGEMVSFKSFKNKIVFVDFWFTGCAGCSSFYNNVVSKVEEHYINDSTVAFVTVSTDKFKEKWLNGLKSGLYTSDLAVNLYTDGKGTSHPIIIYNKINYQPVAMLIDAKGIIRYFNTDNLYNEKQLLKTIEELKATIE